MVKPRPGVERGDEGRGVGATLDGSVAVNAPANWINVGVSPAAHDAWPYTIGTKPDRPT
jgi:hypothetical protein